LQAHRQIKSDSTGVGVQWLALAFVALCALTPGFAPDASAQLAEGNDRLSLPPSQLDKPFENPVFLTGHLAFGGGFQNQSGDLGYGGSLIFRPGSPVNIFSGFMNWRAGMVVQLDYLKIPDGGDITSLDLILRRYFGNRGDRKVEVNPFLGLGTGAAEISLPDPNDIATGEHWSLLVEAGQEWFFKPTFMFFLKGQYRWLINAGRTYQTWSVMVGAGFSWP
jgi:hypothetical protein